MILSDADIRQGITTGSISIDPFKLPHLNPASYTLTLGSRLFIPTPSKMIDSTNPRVAYEEIEIPQDGYLVEPGVFLLGSAAEQLGIATSLAARLDARTSLARLGLNVLQGSTHIEPGQSKSHETLEITNISHSPILIHAGMKIVKVVFVRLSSPATKGYAGAYRGQKHGRI